MNIILDTNTYFKDWKFNNEDSVNFLAFVKQTKSKIYIPKIVWEEIKLNYKDELIKKHKEYERASKIFGSTLATVPALTVITLDYNAEVRNYLDFLCNKLGIIEEIDVLPYDNLTERLAKRALAKRRPFNGKNEKEFKDSLLWECVLDMVSGNTGSPTKEVAFISRDGNAFKPDNSQQSSVVTSGAERDKGKLHAQLQEDVDKILLSSHVEDFYYYESFPEFLSAHYTPIKGIDGKSATDFLSSDLSNFGAQLWEILLADRDILLYPIRRINPTYKIIANFEELTIDEISQVEDFYIFAKKNNKISAAGSVSVNITLPIDYNHFAGGAHHRLKHVLHIPFNIYYADGKVVDLRIETVVVIPGEWLEIPRIQMGQRSLFANFEFYSKVEDVLFELDDDPPFTYSKPDIQLANRQLASNSKYLPRKVSAEKKKRKKPKTD